MAPCCHRLGSTGVPSHTIPQCETAHLDKAPVVAIEIHNKGRNKEWYSGTNAETIKRDYEHLHTNDK